MTIRTCETCMYGWGGVPAPKTCESCLSFGMTFPYWTAKKPSPPRSPVEDTVSAFTPRPFAFNMLEHPPGGPSLKKEPDEVEHPSHYTKGGIESIDVIKAKLTPEQYEGFLIGNSMKYVHRLFDKGDPKLNAEKAIWYLKRYLKDS